RRRRVGSLREPTPTGARRRRRRAHGGKVGGARERTPETQHDLGALLRGRYGIRGARRARVPRRARRAVLAPAHGIVHLPDGGLRHAGARSLRLAARGDELVAGTTAAVAPRAAAAAEEEARMKKRDWLERHPDTAERPIRFSTVSDMEVDPVYTAEDVTGSDRV